MEQQSILDDPQITAVKNALQTSGTAEDISIQIRIELEELGVGSVTTVVVDEDGKHADITFVIAERVFVERIER